MQYYNIIVARNSELIEVVIINLHPVITNRVIIMDSLLNVSTKYPDKILMYFGNMFQCFGVCWLD